MPALSLRSGRAIALGALLASILGILLVAPVTFAGSSPDDQYGGCGAGGCDGPTDGGGKGNAPSGSGNGGGSSPSGASGGGSGPGGASSSGAGTRLGPDTSVAGAGSDGGSDSGSASANASDSASDDGSNGSSGKDKAADKLNGRSLGQVLSGGTDQVATAKPAASTDAGTRAAQAVTDGGGSGLLWLLLALGAVTAVAAGGVAVRRRQARQGYIG